jgi:uncharacterized protein (TIGR04222 family)
MATLAESADTWGISGPSFLIMFGGMAVVLLAFAIINRRIFLRTPSDGQRLPEAAKVALIGGGPNRAIYSSVASLRAAGAIGVGNGGTLTVTGPAPAALTRLDSAVYDAAQRGLRVGDLARDLRVSSIMAELTDGAQRAGWLVEPERRSKARVGGLLLLGLALIGVLRSVAGILNDRPVLGVIGLTITTLVAGIALTRVPRVTPAYTAAVADLRRRNSHLAPNQYPAWATYGPAGAAMGVALYGTAAIWAADPAFAAQAELEQVRPSSGDGGAGASGVASCGGGGDGGGGGGGCGGGGCGG